MSKSEFCIIMTACESGQTSDRIIDALLERKWAACIQTRPITSHYIWKGRVCKSKEILLHIKTAGRLYTKIEQLIKDLHDYEVPEIIRIPIDQGSASYIAWMDSVVGESKPSPS